MQSTPEPEVPVENNLARDSTTESSADAIKVTTTPAVPSEIPASPPSAPAITEDVASVAKVTSRQPDFCTLFNPVSNDQAVCTYMMIANKSFARVCANDSEAINSA